MRPVLLAGAFLLLLPTAGHAYDNALPAIKEVTVVGSKIEESVRLTTTPKGAPVQLTREYSVHGRLVQTAGVRITGRSYRGKDLRTRIESLYDGSIEYGIRVAVCPANADGTVSSAPIDDRCGEPGSVEFAYQPSTTVRKSVRLDKLTEKLGSGDRGDDGQQLREATSAVRATFRTKKTTIKAARVGLSSCSSECFVTVEIATHDGVFIGRGTAFVNSSAIGQDPFPGVTVFLEKDVTLKQLITYIITVRVRSRDAFTVRAAEDADHPLGGSDTAYQTLASSVLTYLGGGQTNGRGIAYSLR